MKKSVLILSAIFAISSFMVSCGGGDDELKVYKKMTPEQIRQMKMNYEAKLKDSDQVKAELRASQEREDSLLRLYNAASAKLKMASQEMSSAKEESNMAAAGVEKGLVFKVQIGAFKKFNINDKVSASDNNMAAVKEDGYNKYMVGSFKTFAEADSFKDDLRKMGVKGAFVVAFDSGKKMDIDAAKKKAAAPVKK